MGRIALPRRQISAQRRAPLQHKPYELGMRMGGETLAFIPADVVVRPVLNKLLVQAKDVIRSRTILVLDHSKPLRGIVLAAGPGCNPKKYDHRDKQKRTKFEYSKRFRPNEIKVGDEIEVGGDEIGGYSFETVMYGDRFCFWCYEDDVAAVVVPDAVDSGQPSGSEALFGRDVQGRCAG